MSPRYAAVLAREALFALEALEPRRFLSGDIPPVEMRIDIDAGIDLVRRFSGSESIRFSFQAEVGQTYLFDNPNWSESLFIRDHTNQVDAESQSNEIQWTAPETGTFYADLSVSMNYPDRWARYEFMARKLVPEHGNTADEAQDITGKNVFSSLLGGSTDADWYSFNANAGFVYVVGARYDANISLYASDRVTAVGDWGWDGVYVRPDADTTYYVKVHSYSSGVSPQLYTIETDKIIDDAGDTPQTALAWNMAELLAGELQFGGDLDFYSIEVQAGDTWLFDSVGENFSIVDSDGETQLAYAPVLTGMDSWPDYRAHLTWTAPHAGVFYVGVSPYGWFMSGRTEGPYTLRATPARIDAAPGDSLVLKSGETVATALEQPAEVDFFQFDAIAGAYYSFEFSSEAIMPAGTSLRIETPPACCSWFSGDNIVYDIEGYSGTSSMAQWVAPVSGRFYLSVSAFDSQQTGSYTMTMTQQLDDYPNSSDDPVPVTPGQSVRGTIDYDWDADYFSLAAEAGHIYALKYSGPDLNTPNFDGAHWWYASGPNGDDVQTVIFRAPDAKTYTFSSSGWRDEIYSIEVVDLTPAVPAETAPLIAPGADQPLSIISADTLHYFRFEAEAGIDYHFTISPNSSALDLYVIDAEGRIVTRADESDRWRLFPDRTELLWTAPHAGAFDLAIVGLLDTAIGEYGIHLESSISPSSSTDTAPTLEIGKTVDSIGNSQNRYLRFEAIAGKTYQFNLHSSRGGRVSVVNRDGVLLAISLPEHSDAADGTYRESVQWTAPFDGTYFISVNTWSRYELSAEIIPTPPPPPPIPEPVATIENNLIASVAATLKEEGDNGLFAFGAVAGRSYRFRTVLGTLEDSILGLFDPLTQKVIAVNDDTDDPALSDDVVQSFSSQIQWTADRSGDVYLIVYGFDVESMGNYRLEVYSTSAAMKEETLAAVSIAAERADEMVAAVDDALYVEEDSSSNDWNAWDDSEEGWDDSSDWVDEDVWEG